MDFYNKDGTLTAYALHCGYVEKMESEETETFMVFASPPFESQRAIRKVELYHEHGHYQVRFVDYHRKVEHPDPHRTLYREWESFTSLTEARKKFNSYKKVVNA